MAKYNQPNNAKSTKMKIKITKSKLQEIVKEEALKFKKVLELKKELSEIEKQLNEVKAGPPLGKDGVYAGQKKAVFATKHGNPHLKMEDGEEEEEITTPMDAEVGEEMPNDDVPASELEGETISKAELKDAIEDLETRLGLHGGGEGAPEGEEGGEEFEFDTDEEVPSEDGAEDEGGEGEEEEVMEYGDEHPVPTADAVAQTGPKKEEEEEEAVTENLDEPIEGVSVAQAAKDSPVDDGMEKDKHVKEGEEKKEEKVTIAEAERKRMALLAGIIKG